MTEKEIELVIERLTRRTEQANTYFLKKISQSIKKLSKLKPTEAQKLIQILKYGGSYEEMIKKIEKYTEINVEEIDKIFNDYAKKDQQFYEKFYRYRNIPFLKYDENVALKRQTEALSNIAKNDMFNFSRTNVLGYTTRDLRGNIKFSGLRETYNNVLDEALLNVGQGKETFDSAVGRILNELGKSGLKTLNYESGRNVRLDSAIRTHLQSRLRELHNETQQLIGREIDADGVEITVHENPAPDHADVQGRQFSNEEYDKLQSGLDAKDYKGKIYNLDHDSKNGYRPISEMNCYHLVRSVVLGVSKPRYSDEQLQKIKEDNEKGFELDGKHYTLYEGTQLQRKLEREIRSQKDIQIMSRETDNQEYLYKSQTKINELSAKYKELSDKSGLKPKKDRMKVSGYHKIKIEDNYTTKPKINAPQSTLVIPKMDLEEEFMYLSSELQNNKIDVSNNIYNLKEEELRNANMRQLLELSNKYPHDIESNKTLELDTVNMKRSYGKAYYNPKKIELNKIRYNNKEEYLKEELNNMKTGWHYEVDEKDLQIYTITHEYGHIVEYEYLRGAKEIASRSGRRFNFKQADKDLRDTLISRAMSISNEKLTLTQFKDKYFSKYGKSKNNYEWFAELFAQKELGKETPFTKALEEWLEVYYK